MIAMTLIVLTALYVVLFLVVGFKTNRWATRLTGWGILLAPLIWKTWDIPVGYYRFQKLCEAEAGFKVFVPNPVPAKVIRLDSCSYSDLAAEEILKKRSAVVAVEAGDKKYSSYLCQPVAFAYYERNPEGGVIARLMDKVGKMNGRGETRVLESAQSNADYIFTENLDYPGDRISRQVQQLRSKEGTLIGSSTSLNYWWGDPLTLFIASNVRYCGPPRATSDREYNQLLDLVAPITK